MKTTCSPACKPDVISIMLPDDSPVVTWRVSLTLFVATVTVDVPFDVVTVMDGTSTTFCFSA